MAEELTASVSRRSSERHGDRTSVSYVRLGLAVAAATVAIVAGTVNTIAMSTVNPALLKTLSKWSGEASGTLLDAQVQTARTAPELAGYRDDLVRTLEREPLDFRATRSLAFVDLAQNRTGRARSLLETNARYTLREPLTHIWLISDALERKNYGAFLRESEIVMRDRPKASQPVYELLTGMIDQSKMTDAIARKVAARPDWRAGFFDTFGEKSTNSAAAYDFFRRIAALGAPASSAEQRVWLLHEIGRTDTAEVVGRWKALQTEPLPADEALVRNPGFEGTTAPQPFDWTFYVPEGSFAEISNSPAGSGKALYAEFNGRGDQTVARQILDLVPGRYSLTYRVYPLSDLGRKDLKLRVDCATGKTFAPVVTHTVTAPVNAWSSRSFTFGIPAGCPAQQLVVGIEPGGLTAEVQTYFDDLTIRRADWPLRLSPRL